MKLRLRSHIRRIITLGFHQIENIASLGSSGSHHLWRNSGVFDIYSFADTCLELLAVEQQQHVYVSGVNEQLSFNSMCSISAVPTQRIRYMKEPLGCELSIAISVLSVCLSHISKTICTRPNLSKSSLHVTCGRGSIFWADGSGICHVIPFFGWCHVWHRGLKGMGQNQRRRMLRTLR